MKFTGTAVEALRLDYEAFVVGIVAEFAALPAHEQTQDEFRRIIDARVEGLTRQAARVIVLVSPRVDACALREDLVDSATKTLAFEAMARHIIEADVLDELYR